MQLFDFANCPTTQKPTPPLKWHGGKHYLAPKIVALMPPRCRKPNAPEPSDPGWLHYVEPYFGGGAVLLESDPTGISEVANDIHGELFNFWRVLQDAQHFAELHRIVDAVPFSEDEFASATGTSADAVQRAKNFFVRCRQSLSGRMKDFTSLTRNRTRRGMNEQTSAWRTCIEGLPAVHERLKQVVILNRDALDVIREQDGPRTLFYCDPPYLHETRASTGDYDHEMSHDDHRKLLDLLGTIEGRFMLSGYHSPLYDTLAVVFGWTCHEFDLPNNAAGGDSKRRMTECVWTNY